MSLFRWAAIALLLLQAASAALYSLLLASVAMAYWPAELTSRQSSAQPHLTWFDVVTQTALLLAVVVIYVVVPAAIAVGAGRRGLWVWAGVAYELAWAFLLTPVIVGLSSDITRVGIVGAVLFLVPALGQRKRRARRT
ncbi:MAG TPA: hypothetical protein VKF16_09435 [Candidatus Dormibacteraeota bacterium]|nr:hypothetical protein [Candidatus Dormibacteraeota bacterium]